MSEKALKAVVLLLAATLLCLLFVFGRLAFQEDKSTRHVAHVGPVVFYSPHGHTRVRLAVVCSTKDVCEEIEGAGEEVLELVRQAGMAHMRYGADSFQQEVHGRLQLLASSRAEGGKVELVLFQELITSGVI